MLALTADSAVREKELGEVINDLSVVPAQAGTHIRGLTISSVRS